MKIKNVIIATFSVALLASCGGPDMCGCAQTSLDVMNEMKEAGDDEAKMKEIEETYKADMEACEKFMEEKQKEAGDDEAKKEALMDEMKECPAFKEMQEEMGM